MQLNENNVNLTTSMGITCSSRDCFEKRHTRAFFVFHVFAKQRVTKATICFFVCLEAKPPLCLIVLCSCPVPALFLSDGRMQSVC